MRPELALFPLNPSEGIVVVTRSSSPTPPEKLKDYVRRKRQEHEPPLTLQDVENRSARYGFRVDYTYVSRIENGQKTNPTADILVGLHYGLEAPLLELVCVTAGIPLREADAQDERLLTLFHHLSDGDRALAVKLIGTIARDRGTKPAEVKTMKAAKKAARRLA